MATLAQKIRCEQHAREMLRDERLPQPDRVEYGHTCIRLFWEKSKVVLIVDIDKPPPGFEPVGEYIDDLGELELDEGEEDPDDFDYDDADEELEQLSNGGEDEGGEMD